MGMFLNRLNENDVNNIEIVESKAGWEKSPHRLWYKNLPSLYVIKGIWGLSDEDREKLFTLLNVDSLSARSGNIAYVLPRDWTKTPSSSKIDNILESSWLPQDLHIERLSQYEISDGETLESVKNIIWDRMQQTVVEDLNNVDKIFMMFIWKNE